MSRCCNKKGCHVGCAGSITNEELATLKASGMFADKGKAHFTVRFRVIGGKCVARHEVRENKNGATIEPMPNIISTKRNQATTPQVEPLRR